LGILYGTEFQAMVFIEEELKKLNGVFFNFWEFYINSPIFGDTNEEMVHCKKSLT